MPHRDNTLPAADSGKLSAHVACSVDGCSRPLCAKGLCRPSNGKRFCRQCQLDRRRARTERDTAARSARFEHGECG